MPLKKGKSQEVISANISTEMHALGDNARHTGKPKAQAIAIAMDKAGQRTKAMDSSSTKKSGQHTAMPKK